MLIKRIISGGQTGADRAALDFAIKSGIPHGGWAAKGRIAEDGFIPEKYNVHEAPTEDNDRRIELNTVHSDGTLVITHGTLTGGLTSARTLAEKQKKPFLHINLDAVPDFRATVEITKWIKQHEIGILHVTGPRASKDPGIYGATMKILDTVFFLRVMDDDVPNLIYPRGGLKNPPFEASYFETVEEALDKLISEMSLKDKVKLAGMAEYEINGLHPSLGLYIRNNYHLGENSKLLESCRELTGNKDLEPDAAVKFVILKLWEKLKESYRMRII